MYDGLGERRDGLVYVLVSLQSANSASDQAFTVQQQVAAVQQHVLGRIPPTAVFDVAYRYVNFAFLTGWADLAGLEALAADAEVAAIGVDARVEAQLSDSVPFINADDVQSLGYSGQGITVAVLDTGVDTDHPDLSDSVAPGAWHFLNQGSDVRPGAEDDNGHGTNVAGIITSNGTVASVGVAPDADILAIKVLSADGSGWVSDWVAGADHVVSHVGDYDYMVAINMSLGTAALYDDCPCDDSSYWNQLSQAAVLAARDAGIVTFVSSGNDGSCSSMRSPACLSAAVAVAAVYDDQYGREPDSGTYRDAFGDSFADCYDSATYPNVITCFSNRSPCNALAAPGRLVTAPGMGGGTTTYTGTSQAAPHCSAVAALLASYALSHGRHSTPDDIIAAMLSTGVPTVDWCGSTPNPVRIDAAASLSVLTLPATTLHVPSQYSTIQAAIDAALDGDTVELADGTYTGVGNKNLDFHGKAITARSASSNPGLCIIDCEGASRGFYFHNGEGPGSIVAGVTIINGHVDSGSPGDGRGGGIFCFASSPTLEYCTIISNSAVVGGGFSGLECSATILNSVIAGNSARDGGGVHCEDDSAIFTNCIITRNFATDWGGGVMLAFTSNAAFAGCTITGNEALYGGGVMCYFYFVSPSFTNCLIVGNNALVQAGGVYSAGSSPAIALCTIAANSAGHQGDALYLARLIHGVGL